MTARNPIVGGAAPRWPRAHSACSTLGRTHAPEAQDFRELDDERVPVLTRISGRGKTSGVDLEHMRTWGAALFYIRDGKVTKHVVYFERDRALADLGLED